MFQLECLQGLFQESSILNLAKIFDAANTANCKDTIEKLNLDLRNVLQKEKSNRTFMSFIWKTSPSGNNHIVVIDSACLLFNIWGVNVLFENPIFLEGELDIINFQWFEEDHLIVFDVFYIVHSKSQKCICHFANSSFFTYFTPVTSFIL